MPSSFNNFFRPGSRRSSAVVQGDEVASIRAQQQHAAKTSIDLSRGFGVGSSTSTSSSLNTNESDTTASSSVLHTSGGGVAERSHKALPPLTTSTSLVDTSTASRDAPVKSNSVPSIEVLSPSSNTPRPIWNPGEDSDTNSNASPPLGSYSTFNNLVTQLSPRSQAVLPADAVSHLSIADGNVSDGYSDNDDEEEDDPLFALGSPSQPTHRQPRKTPPTVSTSAFRKVVRPMSPNKGNRSNTGGSAGTGAAATATSSAGLRRPSKVDTPDRHDVMRRAMAEAAATETFGGGGGAAGAADSGGIIDLRTGSKGGAFVDEPQRSDSLTPTPHAQRQGSYGGMQARLDAGGSKQPITDASLSAGLGGDQDKPGEGSLTFDHFGGSSITSGGEVILADGSVLPAADKANAKEGQDTTAFPSRPKLGSRNNSFQSDQGGDAIRDSPVKLQQQQPMLGSTTAKAKGVPGHGKYATVGHAAEPVRSKQTSLAVPGSNGTLEAASSSRHHMHESASASSLLHSPMKRFRRLSDVSINGSKKGASPSGGIAGALAASGLAGMGVGNSDVVQRAQAQLNEPPASATSKGGNKMSRSRSSSIGSTYAPGYEGGMYRDPVTGAMTVRGPGSEAAARSPRPSMHDRMNTMDSSVSFDGSDISSASGLNAAASFALGLQSAEDSLMPPDPLETAHLDDRRATLTPSGIGAVGGLSPSGMGERSALGDADTWHQNDMGAQITGFAVASSKRNADFHGLFPSVPEDDYLIEDYGCALVREILIQGRLYVSENHVCFYANIFGWITNIVLPFSEIVSAEKRMTAYVIPNAIQVATLHAKSTFASFLSRDTTYELIVNIWKLSHPSLRPADAVDAVSDDDSAEGGAADGATAVGHAGDVGDGATTTEKSKTDGEKTSKKSKRKMLKKKLGIKEGAAGTDSLAAPGQMSAMETATIARASSPAANARRQPHRKTTCNCGGDTKHFSTVALETTYPAIPEKIYNLLFTSGFMKDFWVGNQKLTELQMSDWAPKGGGSTGNMLSRDISYIKPLSGSGGFGPKQAKCLLTDDNVHVDFDEFVTTLTTTRTPDVPAGGSFSIKTKTCITWDGGNVSRVVVSCQTDWTGRSMLRSVIDRASIDGQKQYYKDLDVAIRQYIKQHASEFREEGTELAVDAAAASEAGTADAQAGEKAGATAAGETNGHADVKSKGEGEAGGLSQIKEQLQPVLDILGDLVGGLLETSPKALILGAVVLLLVISNLWALRSSNGGRDPRDPHRLRNTPSTRHSARRAAAIQDVDASAEAVAGAVRDVLRDYFEPQPYSGGGGGGKRAGGLVGGGGGDQTHDPALEVQSLLTLLDEVDARVTRLRGHLQEVKDSAASTSV